MNRSFQRWAGALLAVTLLVILWGAFVRVTGSGAGCAEHWPLCNGELMPRSPRIETLIELTHRVTSALSGLLSLLVAVLAFRLTPRRPELRWAAALQLLLMLIEGAIGALLVKKGLVAKNASAARAVVVGAHLVNTFLLLAAQGATYWLARDDRTLHVRGRGAALLKLALLLSLLLSLGASGAITALGDTLFPAQSLDAGIAQDFARDAHFLVRLRVYHPLLALVTGAIVVFVAQALRGEVRDRQVQRAANTLTVLYVAQLGAGLLNLWWLAPAALQILHLLLADLTWLALVSLTVAYLQASEGAREERA